MLVALMTAFTFTSCEDVPAPYDIPNGGNGGETTTEVAEGNGTVDSPYNPLAVVQYIKSLEAGVNSSDYVYIKGIVSSTKEISAQFGNASFYISADGTTTGTQFYVYRVKGLGNKNIASDDEVKVGDEVIICAKVVNYGGNTPETVQGEGYIYALNGKTEGGTTPSTGQATGDGSKENPFNSVAANQMASKLASGAKTDKQYYIKGKVVSVKEAFSAQFGNASFYISDDGKEDNKFYVFRTLYLGNEKWTEGKTNVAVGDEVVVCGSLINYMGNTPETVQGETYLVSLKSNGGGTETPDTPDTPGDDIKGDFEYVVANCGLENATKLSTLTLIDVLHSHLTVEATIAFPASTPQVMPSVSIRRTPSSLNLQRALSRWYLFATSITAHSTMPLAIFQALQERLQSADQTLSFLVSTARSLRSPIPAL